MTKYDYEFAPDEIRVMLKELKLFYRKLNDLILY